MSLDAIGIICGNIKETVKFYNYLGMNFKEFGGEGHFESTNSDKVRIMLDSEELIKKINPKWKKQEGSGIVLCFKQDSAEEVNTRYKKIIDHGYEPVKEPWDAFWGQRYCSVLDPNGNQIDIFSDL